MDAVRRIIQRFGANGAAVPRGQRRVRTPEQRTRQRMRAASVVLALGFGVLGVRAVQLAVLDTPPSVSPSAFASEAVRRGPILDRNGQILASTLDFYTVYANPRLVWDAQDTVDRLAGVLPDVDRERLLRRLNSNARYVPVASGLTPRMRQAVHLLGLPGVGFEVEQGRVYPRQRAAAHVVGYSGRGARGLAGAELAFDAELSEGGRPVSLSIDLTAQHRVESVLREHMALHRAAGAGAVLMRVGTGEILAMASLPDFDPNRISSLDTSAVEPGGVSPLRSLASRDAYELGSVFKPLALAAALESGQVSLDDVFDASQPLRIGGHTINDFRGQNRPLTAREMIIYSSNIAAARMGEEIGGEALLEFYRGLRLHERAPVELAESGDPSMPARFSRVQTMTAAYGHGFTVTPLALTAAYGALANGGVYVPPTLRPVGPGEIIAGEPVMSPVTAARVLGVMRETVVRTQTGSADIEGLDVAGKTGTGLQAVNGRYDANYRVATFVAVFPFDDPQYVLTVTFNRPQPSRATHGFATAGWNAMPAAGEMLRQLAGVLNIRARTGAPDARADMVAELFAPRARPAVIAEEPLPLPSASSEGGSP